MSRPVRLAVPNKGRLQEPSTRLLRDAGLAFEQTERALTVPVNNVELELMFVRADDVPELVADGVAELGITGVDLLAESDSRLPVLAELGYGRCRLVAAVPNGTRADKPEDFAGYRVATSHPRATAAFFADHGVEVTIVPLRGSVEVAPKLGVSEAVVDLVSSGSTMLVNGLSPRFSLLESQAVLVAGTAIEERHMTEAERVTTMFKAVVAGRSRRYVLMNAPAAAVDAIERIIPGLEAPTVVPLAHEGMVALHSVVDTDELWRVLPDLEAAGASGILVVPIAQMVP